MVSIGALVVVLAAAAYIVPALVLTRGAWPAPLDDVYIHLDFARSTALGRPFSWVIGNGYSSGCTSVLYPFVLAPGHWLGLRGTWLAAWATVVAIASLIDVVRSFTRVLASRAAQILLAPILVCAPLLDWTLFSGMEVAFALALLARALAAAHAASIAPPLSRPGAQRRAGAYLAALALTRPECVVLAPLLTASIARSAGAASALRAALRALGPTVVALGLQALANEAFTGEFAAAGAIRKLITNDPYAAPIDVALLVLRNLMELATGGVEYALGGRLGAATVYALALAACVSRSTRALALPLSLGALGALLLASVNTTAPFQNMRYAMPTVAMLLLASALGADVVLRRGGGALSLCVAALGLLAIVAGRRFPSQISHFARSSRNIVEQQVRVGALLADAEPRPRRVLVGDAGAIPFISGLPALDGLGLGGYHDLPFARASVHGQGAVVELIERMRPEERPDVFAIYTSWWPGLVPDFGVRMFDVTIEDNIICADRTKTLYRADWSLLEPRTGPFVDRLDVGDLVDEREHAYEMPHPHAGYITTAILFDAEGVRRFDAGRTIPMGREERFALRGTFDRGPRTLVVRTDEAEPRSAELVVDGVARVITLDPTKNGAWSETRLPLADVAPGSVVRMRGLDGPLRSFAFSLE
ncbi:MAG: hypothetical protein U0414_34455 [Polyangiaceae bacterium]